MKPGSFSERFRFDDVVVETFVSAGFANQTKDLAFEADFHEAIRLAEDGRHFGQKKIESQGCFPETDLVQIRLDHLELWIHKFVPVAGFPGDDGREDA